MFNCIPFCAQNQTIDVTIIKSLRSVIVLVKQNNSDTISKIIELQQ